MEKKKYGLGSMKGVSKKSHYSSEKKMNSEKPKARNIQKLSSIATTCKKIKGTDKY